MAIGPDGFAVAQLFVTTTVAHTLHLSVQGSHGPGTITLALPALAVTDTTVRVPGLLLPSCVALGLLAVGIFLIVRYRRYLWVGVALVVAAFLVEGIAYRLHTLNETRDTSQLLPISIEPNLSGNGRLDFKLTNPADTQDTFADIVPDHGKLLHLFMVREPASDVLLHLHPEQTSAGHFSVQLPVMAPGTYMLYGDFYRRDGRNVTAMLRMSLPGQSTGAIKNADDSYGNVTPISSPNTLTDDPASPGSATAVAHLLDGYSMQLRTADYLTAYNAYLLHVTLLDPSGKAPQDMALYLGMNAHAIVIREDESVFAHIHPGGTLPMPAGSMPGMDMSAPVANSADIPYGFPSPGKYRLFVQMKHGTVVETGAFDLRIR